MLVDQRSEEVDRGTSSHFISRGVVWEKGWSREQQQYVYGDSTATSQSRHEIIEVINGGASEEGTNNHLFLQSLLTESDITILCNYTFYIYILQM